MTIKIVGRSPEALVSYHILRRVHGDVIYSSDSVLCGVIPWAITNKKMVEKFLTQYGLTDDISIHNIKSIDVNGKIKSTNSVCVYDMKQLIGKLTENVTINECDNADLILDFTRTRKFAGKIDNNTTKFVTTLRRLEITGDIKYNTVYIRIPSDGRYMHIFYPISDREFQSLLLYPCDSVHDGRGWVEDILDVGATSVRDKCTCVHTYEFSNLFSEYTKSAENVIPCGRAMFPGVVYSFSLGIRFIIKFVDALSKYGIKNKRMIISTYKRSMYNDWLMSSYRAVSRYVYGLWVGSSGDKINATRKTHERFDGYFGHEFVADVINRFWRYGGLEYE